MRFFQIFAVVAFLPHASMAAPSSKKAAKKIWKVSKKWVYDASATGSTGRSQAVKVHLDLTGKPKGKVATYVAFFSFPTGGKKCRVKVEGTLGKGSYSMKKRPLVEGTIGFDRITSSCSLPDYLKKKVSALTLPLRLGLVGKKLCAAIGSQSTDKSRDCFLKKKNSSVVRGGDTGP